MRRIVPIAIVLAVLAVTRGTADSDSGAFEVIVNPKSPLTEIDRDTLRDVFLKKVIEEHGVHVHPIDLPSGATRDAFTHDVLRKTRPQLRSYWSTKIFTGNGVPPPQAESIATAIDYVVATPGAIGYIPAGSRSGAAKVVPLR